jgi:hypothetical protein
MRWATILTALVLVVACPARTDADDRKAALEFLHTLTLPDADAERLRGLVGQLDADTFKVRDKAWTALVAEGPRALPLVRRALPGATLEKRLRLERVIQMVEPPHWAETVGAAAQLLRGRRPERALAALLDYVPFAPEDAVDDVLEALCGLGVKEGKVDALLVAALTDKVAAKRAAAAVAVGAFGSAAQRKAVLPLLNDKDATVRCRAAQGLLAARERQAIPALIALLPTGDASVPERAEGLLLTLADKTAPAMIFGDTTADREKCHAAWLTWWDHHRDKLDLARAEVGLALGNRTALARKTAEDFLRALVTGDKALMGHCSAVPFHWGNDMVLQTREEFDKWMDYLKQMIDAHGREAIPQMTVTRVVTVAQQIPVCSSDAELAYVKAQPPAVTVVVQVSLGNNRTGPMVIRLGAGRGRVIGLLEPKELPGQ